MQSALWVFSEQMGYYYYVDTKSGGFMQANAAMSLTVYFGVLQEASREARKTLLTTFAGLISYWSCTAAGGLRRKFFGVCRNAV